MIEVTEGLLNGMKIRAGNVVMTELPEYVQDESPINVVEYVLAHTFERASNLQEAKADLAEIMRQLSMVRDNIIRSE